ncbi:MAG: hypothetical protein GY756_24570 [bacterium]|nr:hypothetical protein [bacterium]
MNRTFTNRNKVGILIFSILNIIGYACYIIMNVISSYENINMVNFYTKQITNLYMIIFFICWIGVLGLTFYSLKGLWSGYKWRLDKLYYVVSLIVFIIYCVLYYPLYVFPLSNTVWIILAFIGTAYSLFFLAKSSD